MAMIDGHFVTSDTVTVMKNCRLEKTYKVLSQLLMLVESEIEQRKEALK